MSLSMSDKAPSGYKSGQFRNFTPQQMQLFQQLFQHVGPESFLSKLAGGGEEGFAETEAPAKRQFSELLGGLSSRFSGQGLGGRHSSGFQNAATSAASNFAQELQSNRQNLQRQAIMDLIGMSQNLLGQKPVEKFIQPKREKQGMDWGGLLQGGIQALPQLLALL